MSTNGKRKDGMACTIARNKTKRKYNKFHSWVRTLEENNRLTAKEEENKHLTDSLFDNEVEPSIPTDENTGPGPAVVLPTLCLIATDKAKLAPVHNLPTPKMELTITLSSDYKDSNARH